MVNVTREAEFAMLREMDHCRWVGRIRNKGQGGRWQAACQLVVVSGCALFGWPVAAEESAAAQEQAVQEPLAQNGVTREPLAREWVRERLEAAVRSGEATAAAEALAMDDGNGHLAIDRFWRAHACWLAGRLDEAARLFVEAAADRGSEIFQEAVLSHGALWASRGETGRAMRALEEGLDSEDGGFLSRLRLRLAELHLAEGGVVEARALLKAADPGLDRAALEARAAIMSGLMDEAMQLAGPVAAQAPAGAARDTARLVQARIKAEAGQILEADRALLEWVRTEPTTVPLASVVLALEEFEGLAAEEVSTLFQEWKNDPRPALAATAAYGQAAAVAARGDRAAAATAFDAFATNHPTHALAPVARARSIEAAIAAGRRAEARAWAEAWREAGSISSGRSEQARAAFMVGLAAWDDQAPAVAIDAFAAAAAMAPDAATQRAALINRALSAVEAGRKLALNGLERWPDAGRLVFYEAGMFGARTGDAQATSRLEAFLASGAPDDDERLPSAWAALVELDLAHPVPATAAARQRARAARRAATTPAWQEHADWLASLVEAAAGEWSTALDRSAVFLATWPQTERRAQVRFHRAEWFGRLDDWDAAIREYAALAAEADTQPAAAARAHYLAGLAEIKLPSPDALDRAIVRWRDAAALDEAIFFPARYQQALAKARLGQVSEALRQLDTLLTGPPSLTPAQQSAVQLARGELLLVPVVGGSDRSADALAALKAVMEASPDPSLRRARALCRQGEALAQLGRTDEALAALTEAAQPLLAYPIGGSTGTPATLWPARAGLAAVRLLETDRQWPAAARLAQQLAATPGPHAAAARARAARLRLEHFIWEE